MRPTSKTFARHLRHLRTPVLTILVGMGFVVGASAASSLPPSSTVETPRDSLVKVEASAHGVLPASGWSALAGHEARTPPRRAGNGPGEGLDGPDEAPGLSGSPLHRPSQGSGALSSPTQAAAAGFASYAQARFGRLSAPSTAPPSTPF